MSRQQYMYGGLAIWAVLMFVSLIANVRAGHPVNSIFAVLLASPLLLVVLGVLLEGRNPGDVLNVRNGSWAFVLGDSIALTAAAAFASIAWRAIPHQGWIVSWWWTALSGLIGLMAGVAFHLMDRSGYINAGAGDRVLSPTKLAHDFVAYPVLFGGLVCIGVPLLLHWSWHTWAILGCVGLWLVFVVRDGVFANLNPFELHPAWDSVLFRSPATNPANQQ